MNLYKLFSQISVCLRKIHLAHLTHITVMGYASFAIFSVTFVSRYCILMLCTFQFVVCLWFWLRHLNRLRWPVGDSLQPHQRISLPISLRQYISVKCSAWAFLNEVASASSWVSPYELTAITRPPLVTTCPSLTAVPAWKR